MRGSRGVTSLWPQLRNCEAIWFEPSLRDVGANQAGFETEEIGPAWLGIPKDLRPWGADRGVLGLVYLRVTMRPDASRGLVEQERS
jgi:hypothetical protein